MITSLPNLSELSHAQKDELILLLFGQVQTLLAQHIALSERTSKLEGQVSLNSRNSSKPPSSDGLSKPAPKSLRGKSGKPNGGQKGHEGATLSQSAQVDEVITHQGVAACTACHAPLNNYEVVDKRQVFELPVLRAQVIEHHLMRARCSCGQVHQGQWPQGINAPVQYGSNAKALAVYLNQNHFIPMQRSCMLMKDIFGINISQASLQSSAQQAEHVVTPIVAAIGKALQDNPVLCADETGVRINGKLHWLHCVVTSTLTWLGAHEKRGIIAFKALGILEHIRSILVHDGLASYKNLDCTHVLCNAHHLRELVYVHEREGVFDDWADAMKKLLLQAKDEVGSLGAALPQARQDWYQAQWETLLQRGEVFNPQQEHEGAPTGKQGRKKQSKEYNLLKRLRDYREDVWRFITDAQIPFTNNLAEQALRMSKVRQKISGCFRTEDGAKTFFTIRSYLATMHKQKANIFECLVSVFQGKPIQPQLA